MKKKTLIFIGFILVGVMVFCSAGLYASDFNVQIEEVEYTGADTPDTIEVTVAEAPRILKGRAQR